MTDDPLGPPYPVRFRRSARAGLAEQALAQYGRADKAAHLVRRYVREGIARDRGSEGAGATSAQLKEFGERLKALRLELARTGGNLNQIAHAVNIDDRVNGQALSVCHDQLRHEFRALMALLKEVERGLLHSRD